MQPVDMQSRFEDRLESKLHEAPEPGASWTIPGEFQSRAISLNDAPAFRAKERGIWRTWTYRDAADEVGALAAGLAGMELVAGDRVGIIGANNPRLYIAVLACQAIGAVPVVFHENSVASELRGARPTLRLRLAIVTSSSHVQAIAALLDRKGARVVRLEAGGAADDSSGDSVIEYGDLCDTGRERVSDESAWLSEMLRQRRNGETALISVQFDASRGLAETALTHEQIRRAVRVLAQTGAYVPGADAIAYLPMNHYADQVQFFSAVLGGATLNTPESSDTLMANLREISPTVLIGTPTVYAKFLRLHEERLSVANRLVQKIVSSALKRAENDKRAGGLISRFFVLNPVRKQLGMASLSHAISTQATVPDYLRRFFRALGINFYDLYGNAQSGGAISVSDSGAFREADTIVQFDEDGAVSVRLDPDGWTATGDMSRRQPDGWTLIGRAGTAFALSDGTRIQPEPIELHMADSIHVRAALLYCTDARSLGVAILPNFSSLMIWARREGAVSFSNVRELLENPETGKHYAKHVAAVLRSKGLSCKTMDVRLLTDAADAMDSHGRIDRARLAAGAITRGIRISQP